MPKSPNFKLPFGWKLLTGPCATDDLNGWFVRAVMLDGAALSQEGEQWRYHICGKLVHLIGPGDEGMLFTSQLQEQQLEGLHCSSTPGADMEEQEEAEEASRAEAMQIKAENVAEPLTPEEAVVEAEMPRKRSRLPSAEWRRITRDHTHTGSKRIWELQSTQIRKNRTVDRHPSTFPCDYLE